MSGRPLVLLCTVLLTSALTDQSARRDYFVEKSCETVWGKDENTFIEQTKCKLTTKFDSSFSDDDLYFFYYTVLGFVLVFLLCLRCVS